MTTKEKIIEYYKECGITIDYSGETESDLVDSLIHASRRTRENVISYKEMFDKNVNAGFEKGLERATQLVTHGQYINTEVLKSMTLQELIQFLN